MMRGKCVTVDHVQPENMIRQLIRLPKLKRQHKRHITGRKSLAQLRQTGLFKQRFERSRAASRTRLKNPSFNNVQLTP
jgi:hypothetical protein